MINRLWRYSANYAVFLVLALLLASIPSRANAQYSVEKLSATITGNVIATTGGESPDYASAFNGFSGDGVNWISLGNLTYDVPTPGLGTEVYLISQTIADSWPGGGSSGTASGQISGINTYRLRGPVKPDPYSIGLVVRFYSWAEASASRDSPLGSTQASSQGQTSSASAVTGEPDDDVFDHNEGLVYDVPYVVPTDSDGTAILKVSYLLQALSNSSMRQGGGITGGSGKVYQSVIPIRLITPDGDIDL